MWFAIRYSNGQFAEKVATGEPCDIPQLWDNKAEARRALSYIKDYPGGYEGVDQATAEMVPFRIRKGKTPLVQPRTGVAAVGPDDEIILDSIRFTTSEVLEVNAGKKVTLLDVVVVPRALWAHMGGKRRRPKETRRV